MRFRLALLAAMSLGVAGDAMAQGSSSPTPTQQPTAAPGLTRAEVLADLDLWHRAGLTYWPRPPAAELDPQFVPDYQAALGRYQQLRAGPAFQEAVIKYQGMSRQ